MAPLLDAQIRRLVAVPADIFFGVWADFQRPERLVELQARIVEGRLQLSTTPGSPIQARDNRIHLEDGRELVIQAKPAVQHFAGAAG